MVARGRVTSRIRDDPSSALLSAGKKQETKIIPTFRLS